ncbi:MAG: hypothetical protein ACRDQY_15865 [Pseudonocardiaceae bacterium]
MLDFPGRRDGSPVDSAAPPGLAPRPGLAARKLAQQYNTVHPGPCCSDHRTTGPPDHRTSEYESWPHGGAPPSVRYLARLAAAYGHGCTPSQFVDADDLEHLIPADRCLLTTSPGGHVPAASPTSTTSR